MTNKDHIQQEIEKTLQSLDEAKRAGANPFLFTRIQARMQKQNGWDNITSYVTRPAIAFTVLFMVIAVNAFVLFNSGNNREVIQNDSIAVSDISEEYTIAATTNYDYENMDNE